MTTNGCTTSTINLSDSWGSTLAGVFVSLVLYGISILQTFLYYERYTEDTILLKSLVAWVFVLDTLHIFLICAGVWQYFVVHFGDDTFLASTHAPLVISLVVTSTVSSTVQSFFIYRIWLCVFKWRLYYHHSGIGSVTRSHFRWLLPAILMPFVVAQLVLGGLCTVVAMAFDTSLSAVSGPLLSTAANAGNGVAMAVDITITISLCTLLAMTRTGFHTDTDRMLLRLIFISVNTGLSSALFAFLSVILLVVYPTDLIFTALYYPLCTVYCNTILASLNVRSYVRGGSEIRELNPHSTFVDGSELWQDGGGV